jgi:EmrB/QacA subfamily drug resistance transporter
MHTHRGLVVAAGIMSTFLASLDSTVVGTAMPTIVAELGGLAIYPWVFSAFLLASTVAVPIYGKSADLFGRKSAFFVGVGLFVLGSLLCATSTSMTQLIIWRALQGLGAGGVLPVTMTIMGDLYPAEQRARIQGLFSAVWAVSSIAGPLVGAFIVEVFSWQWIFLVNLPFGLVAVVLMQASLKEEVARHDHKLDLLGAVLLSAATASLMWGVLHGGGTGFASADALIAIGAAVLLGVGFGLQERRHPEPMLPPDLFSIRTVAVACAAGLFVGVILFGGNSYIPAFVQGALGGTPRDAGLALLPMGIGWPVASNLTSRTLKKLGYRGTAILGGVFLTLGTGVFLLVGPGCATWLFMLATGVTGIGLGFSTTVMLIAAQESVPWNRRGATTAMVQFARTIGGAVGVAIMGAVLATSLRHDLGSESELLGLANAIMDPHRRAQVPASAVAQVQQALGVGLSRVLLGVTLAGLIAFVLGFAFPRGFKPAVRRTPTSGGQS